MDLLIRIIAYFEMASGSIGLIYTFAYLLSYNTPSLKESPLAQLIYVLVIILSVATLLAGWLLKKNNLFGFKLSIITQLAQIPIFVTSILTYAFMPVFGYFIYYDSTGLALGSDYWHINITNFNNFWLVGVNFIPILLIIPLWHGLHKIKNNQKLEKINLFSFITKTIALYLVLASLIPLSDILNHILKYDLFLSFLKSPFHIWLTLLMCLTVYGGIKLWKEHGNGYLFILISLGLQIPMIFTHLLVYSTCVGFINFTVTFSKEKLLGMWHLFAGPRAVGALYPTQMSGYDSDIGFNITALVLFIYLFNQYRKLIKRKL